MGIINWIKDYWRDIRKSTGKTFKNVVLTAHFWVILIALGLIISMSVMIFGTLSARKDQNMAEYWQNGGKTEYRQLSVFAKGNRTDIYAPIVPLGENQSLSKKEITDIRKELQGTVDSGKTIKKKASTEVKPTGWNDCYSTVFKANGSYTKWMMINGENKSATKDFEAEVVAVGGDFQSFHPFEYLDGGFLPLEESDPNQIVINDELAWTLFKSYSVSGQRIQILGEDMTIVGVVREKKTKIDRITGSETLRVFCYFSTVDELSQKGYFSGDMGTGEDGSTPVGSPIAVSCYEAMLPEAVRGVAKTDIINALPGYNMNEPQYRVVSNTGRFRVDKVYDLNMPVGEFENKTTGYEFPYWEKASILATQRLFLMEAALLVGIVLLIIGIIIMILRLRKPGGKFDQVEEEPNEDEIPDEVAIEMTR